VGKKRKTRLAVILIEVIDACLLRPIDLEFNFSKRHSTAMH
jgi:hypothetical protein